MRAVLAALARAMAQLPDPSFRSVLWRGLGVALAVYVGLLVLIHFAFELLLPGSTWIAALGTLASVAVLTVLFPTVATACIALFADEVAEAVERKHYPHLPPGRVPPFGVVLGQALRFLAVSLTLNLLALPLYVAGLFLPPLNLFVFYALNGYLLGREYFDLVAQRHHGPVEGRQLRRTMRGRRLLAGLAIAVLFSVPLINLAMSLVATAAMVHLVLGPDGPRAGGTAVKEPEHVQSRQEG